MDQELRELREQTEKKRDSPAAFLVEKFGLAVRGGGEIPLKSITITGEMRLSFARITFGAMKTEAVTASKLAATVWDDI